MKNKLLFLLLLFAGTLQAQTMFWEDDLEGAGGPNLGGGTRTPSLTFSSGGPPATRYFFRTPLSGIATSFPVSGIQGTNCWAAEDVDNLSVQTAHQNVTWTGINISGRTGLQFRGLFGTGGATGAFDNNAVSGNGTDYMIAEYRIDGGPWTSAVRFMPISTVSSTVLGLETTGDSIGDGTTLSNTVQEFIFNIPSTGTTMEIRVKVFCNSLVEEMIFDDVRLYEVPVCSNPTITGQPSNSSVCVNGNTSFSITATGATSYQWQVNCGSGFTNVTNGGVYSGATTATLTITGATAGMNGCQYRCLAMQSPCSTTSNNATLTVSNPSITPASQTNVACNGGSSGAAAVNAAGGGIAPYTYNWTPGNPTGDGTTAVTGLTAGTWTCTVTDNIGCSANTTFNITQPTAITLTALSQTNVSCFGGSNGAAAVNAASGGAGGYTYNWTPGNPTGDGTTSVTGLIAGTWTCTVTDANSCQTTRTFNITSPTALVLTPASQTNVACNGGSTGAASVNAASGGAGGYTYNWTPGNPTGDGTTSVTGLTAGTWTCTVTDANSCITTATFNITAPTALVVSPASQTNVSCNGGSNGAASINTPTGGAGGYTYNWTPGNPTGDGTVSVTGLTAGTWTCTVTDANSCVASQTFNITAPSAIVVTAASQTNVSCNGGSNGAASINTPTGGAGGYTYNWTPGNPTGDGTVSVTGLTAGTWTCTVTDANSCVASQTFNITAPSAIVVTAASQTNVSCNGGSNGAASINTPTGGAGGYTYNWTPGNPTGDGTVSVTGLTAGTWTCTVTDANSCMNTATFNITAPSALVVSAASQTNVSCNGGSNGAASINTPTGGAGGYTYNWTPGNPTGDGTVSVTGLTAGTWTCTVTDANSCVASQTFNITAPSAIVVTAASQTNVSCNGGSNGAASINTPTGGAGGYTYNWTPGNPTGDGTVSVTGLTAGTWTCTVTDANSCVATATFNITAPSAIVVTAASQTNVSCNGGSNGAASINTPTGGAGGYTYNWTPGNPTGDGTVSVTGLTAGTWTCTVTDANSCMNTATFNITAPSALVVSAASQTNVSCNGGSNGAASVTVSGGVSAYSYNWTPGNPTGDGTASVTGLTAGTWTCTVTDANSCVNTATFNITAPSALVVSAASQTNVSCNGGSNGAASVTVSGGTTAYSYNWTPGNPTGDGTASVTGLTAGTWTCTVTDANSCVNNATFSITAPSAIVVTAASQTNVSCNGGSNGAASINTPTGGAGGYTYNWTPGNPTGDGTVSVTGLTAGTWTCTVTDANSCVATRTFNITAPTAIVITPASQTNISCNGGSNGAASINTPTGGAGGYTYNWTPGNPTGDGTTSVTGLTAGTWTITVTDANSCVNTATFNITAPSVLSSSISQTNVSCAGGNNGTATVSPSGGTPAYTYSWAPSGGTSATATGLASGCYTCTITDANGCTTTASVCITQPIALSVSSTVTNVSCNAGANGSVMVTVIGGTGGYSYSWAPSGGTSATASGLSAGSYTCTVTDGNGCTITHSVAITEPSALTSTNTSADITCFGANNGSAAVSVSGGNGPYSYMWSPSGGTGATATGLGPAMYSCTITDNNGCTLTQTFLINEPSAISPNQTQTNISCAGGGNGQMMVSPTGGTGAFTYSWAPIANTTNVLSGSAAGFYTCTITDANGCTATATFNLTEPSALAVTTMQTNVSCNGGSNGDAMVMVSGGTPSYTYAWSSGGTNATETGLSAGTYTCTITDANGCTFTQTVSITEPSALSVSTTQNDILCNGNMTGDATVAVSGGTPLYTYAWSSGGTNATETGLGAGTYTCTITDANNCTTTATVTITEPTAINVTATQVDVTCFGGSDGSIDLTVSGGVGPYTFDWNSGTYTTEDLSNIPAGTYTGLLTDVNGCTSSGTMVITEPSAITSSAVIVDPTGCTANDGSIDLTVSGGTGVYTFAWSNSATSEDISSLDGGTYSVTITDANGCTQTDSYTLTEPGAPTVTYSEPIDTACGGSMPTPPFALSGESPAGGSWSGPGVTGNMFDVTLANLGMNVIVYSYTDTAGCSGSAMDSIWVDLCLGVQPIADNSVNIYPNPSTGIFNVVTAENSVITVYDAVGNAVLSVRAINGKTEIDLSGFANGIYMMTVQNNEQITTERLILAE